MSADTPDPVGVCFGVSSGSVFAARRLPTVLAAEAVSL